MCVSPKAGAPLVLTRGDELKLVYPQDGGEPGAVRAPGLPPAPAAADGRPGAGQEHAAAVEYCLAHPQWRLSLQTHKYLGIA